MGNNSVVVVVVVVQMTQDEYWELVQTIAEGHGGSAQLPWVFSLQPVLVLLSAFGMWTLAFIIVIVVLVDDSSGGRCFLHS